MTGQHYLPNSWLPSPEGQQGEPVLPGALVVVATVSVPVASVPAIPRALVPAVSGFCPVVAARTPAIFEASAAAVAAI